MKNDVPNGICPKCNATLDAATGVGHDYAPEKGDITICAYCANILMFTDNLELVVAPQKELKNIDEKLYESIKNLQLHIAWKIREAR